MTAVASPTEKKTSQSQVAAMEAKTAVSGYLSRCALLARMCELENTALQDLHVFDSPIEIMRVDLYNTPDAVIFNWQIFLLILTSIYHTNSP